MYCPDCKFKVFFDLQYDNAKIISMTTFLQVENALDGKYSVCKKCGYEVVYDKNKAYFLFTTNEIRLLKIKKFIKRFI